jgi:hypothetical protein
MAIIMILLVIKEPCPAKTFVPYLFYTSTMRMRPLEKAVKI